MHEGFRFDCGLVEKLSCCCMELVLIVICEFRLGEVAVVSF